MMKRYHFTYICLLVLLVFISIAHKSYGGPNANISREIRSAYIKGDYATTIELLQKHIAELKENVKTNKRSDPFNLMQKNIFLAYVYAWKLNQPDVALEEFKNVSELRKSFKQSEKFPPLERIYKAEIYEMKKDLARAKEEYRSFLDEMTTVHDKASDDVTIMIYTDLINLIKYRIDSITLRGPKTNMLLLTQMKMSSQYSLQIAMLSVQVITAATAYDMEVAMTVGLEEYITQSPPNLTSMILNYALVLNTASQSVDKESEKALRAFLKKYPDSYYSLFLRYYFYKFYKENEMTKKGEELLNEIQVIAKKRGMKIITGPDKRLSSPEKTWDLYRKALIQGDVDTVVECYVPGGQTRKMFSSLTKEQLKEIGWQTGDIKKITGNEERAKYRIWSKYADKDVSFHINFVNIEGEWKMYDF